ncbi:MAG: SpoVA/SpoVAEb family sporulation membrane protein [Christensenellales bacterium]
MEFKREGLIGIGANLFKIAGPVLVNGISAAMLYGVVFFLFGR